MGYRDCADGRGWDFHLRTMSRTGHLLRKLLARESEIPASPIFPGMRRFEKLKASGERFNWRRAEKKRGLFG